MNCVTFLVTFTEVTTGRFSSPVVFHAGGHFPNKYRSFNRSFTVQFEVYTHDIAINKTANNSTVLTSALLPEMLSSIADTKQSNQH